ncbi:MAG: methylenetetrahydrofolate reductase, partial [Acidobacteriaceae bacterium]
YAITQPVFDLRLLEAFLKRVEQFRLPVIAGIWPLISLRNAEFMRNDLRVFVPDDILLRMQQADTPELARAEGVKIAQEMLIAARDMVQGVQVSAPSGRFEAALTVMESVLPNRREQTVKSTVIESQGKVRKEAEQGVNLGKL